MTKNKFKVSDNSKQHKELLHYTNLNVLNIILNQKTLLFNSLKNVNDKLEHRRKGIENIATNFFISSFCHCPYEIVPFWILYGGNNNNQKLLLRFNNFANNFENTFEKDYGITPDGKKLFFDIKNLFNDNDYGFSCNVKKDNSIENRQTIMDVHIFDVCYKTQDDDVFNRNYNTIKKLSADDGLTFQKMPVKDATDLGKHKAINWSYEEETRIMCRMQMLTENYFDYLLLRFKDEVFKELKIVANPWATNDFIKQIQSTIEASNLPNKIKSTIQVVKSELDGQIIPIK